MLRPLIFSISLAMLLAACGGGDDAVAMVNGQDIAFEDVQGLQYDTETDLTTAEYSELLDVYIAWTAFIQEAREQYGIEPTEDEIQAEITKILFESAALDQESFLEAQNISINGLRLTAIQILIDEGLETALVGETDSIDTGEAEAMFAEFPAEFTEVCLNHILLTTEEEAAEVVSQLESGAVFAELAAERSQDPSSASVEGDLGCAPASQFVPEFAEAAMVEPVGELFGPLQTDFGFHVMVVTSRATPTLEEVVADLQADAVFEAIDAWYIDVLGRADVTVDPQYGTWQSGSNARLVPPTG